MTTQARGRGPAARNRLTRERSYSRQDVLIPYGLCVGMSGTCMNEKKNFKKRWRLVWCLSVPSVAPSRGEKNLGERNGNVNGNKGVT